MSGLIAGNASQLLAQVIAAAVAVAWGLGMGLLLFRLLKVTIGLRATEEEEISGLDMPEHGEEAYPVDEGEPQTA